MESSQEAARAGGAATPPGDRLVPRASRSIRVRFLLGVLLSVAPLYLASHIVGNRLAERELLRAAEREADAHAQHVAGDLAGVTRLIEERVEALALTLASVDVNAGELEALIRGLVGADSRIYGSTVAFEPRAFSATVEDFAPYVHRFGGELRQVDLARPEYGYRRQDWYRLPLDAGQARWSEPYFDRGGGDIWMLTYSVPFRMRGKASSAAFSGVVTADLSLAWLRGLVAGLHMVRGGVAFLVSPGGVFVSHLEVPQPGPAAPSPTTQRLAALRAEGLRLVTAGRTLGQVDDPAGGRAFLAYRRLSRPGWEFGLALPEASLLAPARQVAQVRILFALLGLAALVLAVSLVSRRITRPLEAATEAVARIGRGDLDATLPAARGADEVAILTDAVERMRLSLRQHIEEQARALAARERLAGELEIARQIQQSMLPQARGSEVGGGRYAVSAVLHPAREVGGDLYDFFTVADHRLLFAVGDVSGKGIPAALLMAEVAALLRAVGQTAEPDRILTELNARLARDNEACMFVTLGCGILDGRSGRLRYAGAGHEPPLVRRVGGQVVPLSAEGGPALGLDAGGAFACQTFHLAPGDCLVAYTDGVTEAFDPDGRAFGSDRLARLLAEAPGAGPQELADRVMGAVERFAAGGGPLDDATLLVLQYRLPDVTMKAGPAEEWRVSAAARLAEVPRVQESVAAILRARDVPSRVIDDCLLIVEEVVANVVTHAYGEDPRERLQVDVRVTAEGQALLRFADDGPAFDPLEHPAPDLEASLDERPVGGLGVWLVRQLAARCDYVRENGQNVLTITCGPDRGGTPEERG